ncbi:MAG: cation:proton antiporter [Clostridiales bacterium]|nr:cation:proton antiporter [Clostridiales bacterium]
MPQLNTLLYLAILLIAGLLCGRLVKQVKLPNVTGYLIAGLVLGPHVLNIIPIRIVDNFEVISQIALSFIAFTIGCDFKISYFKRVGATPIVIAVFEAMLAVFLVQGILIAVGFDPAFSIVLGSIAAATAPAATVMVIKQYNARGPVTEMLLSVVAIDDAVAIIAFGFSVAIAGALGGGTGGSVILSILLPIKEIFLALLVGALVGILFKIPLKYFKKSGNRIIILAGMVFLSSGLAEVLNASQLLACMMTGCVLCNITEESASIAQLSDFITPPIFLLFFAVSGANLDISIIPSIGVVGILYVTFRVIGKIAGASLGAKIMKAPEVICKYLGPALIPQAGVAIGLVTVATTVVPQLASEIRAVILCATMIYEIVGPAISKAMLVKAGEIPEEKKVLTKKKR